VSRWLVFPWKNNALFSFFGSARKGEYADRHANLYINIPYLTKKYELIIIKHLSKVSIEKRRHIPGLT
jgi:hypothetical protein